jgi:hypothetical protein
MAPPTWRNIGNSRTKPQPTGKTIPILAPEDIAYLCAHICLCNCTPKISRSGRNLYQRCVTMAIRLECDAAKQEWKYKAEVGYNMATSPPSPIMAAIKRNTPTEINAAKLNNPLQFPIGTDTQAVADAIALALLMGRPQRGFLRIPDVVIVKDMHNFDLSQPNIAFVVEIKFKGDRLRKRMGSQFGTQEEDYMRIAGDPGRFKVLTPTECDCEDCKEKVKAPAMAPAKAPAAARGKLPQKAVVPDWTQEWKQNLATSSVMAMTTLSPIGFIRMSEQLKKGVSSFDPGQLGVALQKAQPAEAGATAGAGMTILLRMMPLLP